MGLDQFTWRKQFIAKYTVESADVDTTGYAEISNTGALGAFTGATVPALGTAVYDLDVTIDGGSNNQLNISIVNTDDWDTIVGKIQTQLQTATSSTETVTIVSGKIRITSATEGASSAVLIAAGTGGSGGGDLLAAITALSADYTVTLNTPVAGVEGSIQIPIYSAATATSPSESIIYSLFIKDSSNKDKSGFISTYDTATGLLTVSDDGSTTELLNGDIVMVSGTFL